MSTLYRDNFTTLWVELWADEQLGLLDSDYIEDFDGVDGAVTLHHVDTATDYQVAMLPYPGETPGTDNDVFKGTLPLSSLPDGLFEVRGRARDAVENETVMGEIAGGTPPGARVLSLQLTVATGSSPTIYAVPVTAAFRGGYSVTAGAGGTEFAVFAERPITSATLAVTPDQNVDARRDYTVSLPGGRYQTEGS